MVQKLETRRYDRLHELWQHECYQNLSPFALARKRLVQELIRDFADRAIHILDVGSGIGDYLLTFGSGSNVCLGIDVSEQALKIASKRVRKALFLLADANALPVKTQYFDLAICTELLEHLKADSGAVGEISRALKGDGVAIFTVPQDPKYWTNRDGLDGHLRRYHASDFVRMIQSRNLTIVKMMSWGFPLAFLFRKFVAIRLFNAQSHDTMTLGKTTAMKALARFLAQVFQFDDLFSSLNLGLGIVAVARKTQ